MVVLDTYIIGDITIQCPSTCVDIYIYIDPDKTVIVSYIVVVFLTCLHSQVDKHYWF